MPRSDSKARSQADWQAIAERLNAELARTRLSSQDVAARAGVDRKTVDRLRAGQAVRPQTLQWIAGALGLTLEATGEAPARAAATRYGGYRRDAVETYIGEYTGYRRSFDTADHLIASYLALSWDDDVNALRFTENQRNEAEPGTAYEYHFGGDVLIPPNLGVLHLVVRSDDGRVRLISTSMPREDGGTLSMKGFILTLNEIRDIGYYPVTSPIFFAKQRPGEAPKTGVITPADERYERIERTLATVERRFLPSRS